MIGLCKLSLSALALGLAPYQAHAGDKSGIHAFFNERQEPVRRLLAEQQRQVRSKSATVSRGVRCGLCSTLPLVWNSGSGKKDYHVYCASPTPGRSWQREVVSLWEPSRVPARIAFMCALQARCELPTGHGDPKSRRLTLVLFGPSWGVDHFSRDRFLLDSKMVAQQLVAGDVARVHSWN